MKYSDTSINYDSPKIKQTFKASFFTSDRFLGSLADLRYLHLVKKILLSILTMIYLTVSSGIAMEIHYCMGKKTGLDFYKTADEKKCGLCGMKEKKGGCCNDEHKFFKLADAHKNVSNNYDASVLQVPIINEFISFSVTLPASFDISTLHNNSPPVNYGPPIFIRNCVFRI